MNLSLHIWNKRSDRKALSGRGAHVDCPIDEFASTLIEEAALTVPKGADTKCFSFGRTPTGGGTNAECTEYTGQLLDLDDPQYIAKINAIEADLRSYGQAFIIMRRNNKAGILLPFEAPIVVPADDAGKDAHKRARVGLIELFERRYEIKFDHSPGRLLLGAIYVKNRTEPANGGDGTVTVTWSDGQGLDFGAWLAHCGQTPVAPGAARPTSVFGSGSAPSEIEPWTDTETCLLLPPKLRLHAARNPDREPVITAFLAGESYSTDGEHHVTRQRLVSWIAFLSQGKADVGAVVSMNEVCYGARDADQGAYDAFESQLVTALADAHRKITANRQQLESLRCALATQIVEEEGIT